MQSGYYVTYRLISCLDRVALPVVEKAPHVLPDSIGPRGLDSLREGVPDHEHHVRIEIGRPAPKSPTAQPSKIRCHSGTSFGTTR
jgi:hypothetical protein